MPAAAHVSYPADGVGMILLDNPPMNFASNELLEKVEAAYDAIEKTGARVVLLASDVPGYFIAHAYVPDILNAYTGGLTTGDPRVWRRLTDKLERGSLTSIAVVHGQAWGGGADLCYACNLRLAGRSATFGHVEPALGVFTGSGGSLRLAKLVGLSKAMEMFLTCEPITAEQAAVHGLANKVVDDDHLRTEAVAWATRIAGFPPWAVRAARRGLLQAWDLHYEDALRIEGYIFNSTMKPATFEIMKRVQARYDAGADSREAFGL